MQLRHAESFGKLPQVATTGLSISNNCYTLKHRSSASAPPAPWHLATTTEVLEKLTRRYARILRASLWQLRTVRGPRDFKPMPARPTGP